MNFCQPFAGPDTAFVLSGRVFKTTSFRLSALYGGFFLVAFGAVLLITYLTATNALREQIRTEVQHDLLALTTEAQSDGGSAIVHDIKERIQPTSGSTAYYFYADARGNKLAGNLDNPGRVDGWQETPLQIADTRKKDGMIDEDHQLWGQGMHLPDGSFLFAGQDAHRVLSAQDAIINSFAWSAAISFLLAALAGILASQSFLRRIDAINTTSHAIIDGHLKQRIPLRGTSDEIDNLSMNLNRLFDSNQALMDSLKQVSTSIAHDLRTPLSRLRQGLEEAYLQKSPAKYKSAIESAIIEADQLLSTFSALLRIAQIESGTRRANFKQVDLTALIEQVADTYRAVAEDQQKEMTLDVAPNVTTHGDRDLLMQLLVNLLENALRHTPINTSIVLSLRNGSTGPTVILADSGPGIPAQERGRVFERFYRLDASRSTSGSGLGLSLVAAIASLHDIEVELQDNAPGLKAILYFSH